MTQSLHESFQNALKTGYQLGKKLSEDFQTLYPDVPERERIEQKTANIGFDVQRDIIVKPEFLKQILSVVAADPRAKDNVDKIFDNIIAVYEHKKSLGDGQTALSLADMTEVFVDTPFAGGSDDVVSNPINATTVTASSVLESYLQKVRLKIEEKKSKKCKPKVSLQQIARFISSTPSLDKKIIKKSDRKDAKEVSYKISKDGIDVIVTYEDGNNKLLKTIKTSDFCKKYMKNWLKVWNSSRGAVKEDDIISGVSHEVITNPDEMGVKNAARGISKKDVVENVVYARWLVEKQMNDIKNDGSLDILQKDALSQKLRKLNERLVVIEKYFDHLRGVWGGGYDWDGLGDDIDVEIVVPSPLTAGGFGDTIDDDVLGIRLHSSDSEHIVTRSLVDDDEEDEEYADDFEADDEFGDEWDEDDEEWEDEDEEDNEEDEDEAEDDDEEENNDEEEDADEEEDEESEEGVDDENADEDDEEESEDEEDSADRDEDREEDVDEDVDASDDEDIIEEITEEGEDFSDEAYTEEEDDEGDPSKFPKEV